MTNIFEKKLAEMKQQRLNVDIETFSPVDLKKAGMHRYAEEAEILLLAYSFNGEPVKCLDLTKPGVRKSSECKRIEAALVNPEIRKLAYNAAFEMTLFAAAWGVNIIPEQWECSMMRAAMAGLPMSLDQSSKALNLAVKKDGFGMSLIRYFCIPCKPTQINTGRIRNLPEHDPAKWQSFINYCIRDVETEMAVAKALAFLPIPEEEFKLWALDYRINAKGVKVDQQLVQNAIKLDTVFRERLIEEAIRLTGVLKPNSVKQIKNWLEVEEDITIEDLKKASIPLIMKRVEGEKSKRVLQIRQQLSKTSVKKYVAMANCVCSDSRVKGTHQFYGANRTGRWAGRLLQMQNFPRGRYHGQLLEFARETARDGDAVMLEAIYGPIPDTLSSLIRTAIVADEGNELLVSDFSAIEARVIAWLAGEQWRLDVFATHGKIYEASAAQMFKVPLESIGKGSPLRQRGKVAELALGYAGGANALIAMGALDMGLTDDELAPIVTAWREANKKICALWYATEQAAKEAISTGKPSFVSAQRDRYGDKYLSVDNRVYFSMRKNYLLMHLPSGRTLNYFGARLADGKYGKEIEYLGTNQTTKQWARIRTYSGKLVENMVQAAARDCLSNGMLNLYRAGMEITFHVHDECVCEAPIGMWTIEEMNELMIEPAAWMKGLPMRADGFKTRFYCKD